MILKLKSEENLSAAELLKDSNKHNSSIHCSYYSCVQLAKYILIEKLGKEKECDNPDQSFHKFLINTLYKSIKANHKYKDRALEFKNKIIDLKTLRGLSDYGKVDYDLIASKSAIKTSKRINTILEEIYLNTDK